MGARITPDKRLTGRLSMYKYSATGHIHPYSLYDNMQGRVPSDSGLYVERAYIDWFFNRNGAVPFALTLGRQPSSDGPSRQYKMNTARKATYSALLYDGAADGAVLTANISRYTRPGTYLRFGYAKGYGYTETGLGVLNAFVGPSNSDLKDTNIYGLFLDTTIPGVEQSLVQISASRMTDIIANPLDSNTSSNTNIGDADMFGIMAEGTDIHGSGLDLFAHFGYTIAHPNGQGYGSWGGLLSETGDRSKKYGNAVWVGGRYALPGTRFKLGAEYNHGSKNWISLTQGSGIYNKLATRGDAWEFYAMYVLNRYTNLNVGFLQIDYDDTRSGWFVGPSRPVGDADDPERVLERLRSLYFELHVKY
jgi:hypothetical protein